MGLHGGKKKDRFLLLIVCVHLGFAPFLHFPWRVAQQRWADPQCWDQSPAPQTPQRFRGGPLQPGDKPLTSVPFPHAKQILGLKRHFNPDSLSTWSCNSAPIYFLYRQASVKTLPRFEGMFDTIVSSSSTFNCWSENLLNLILHFLTCVICYSSFLQL